MADTKPPKLSVSDDKQASVRIWRRKFNSWCLLQKGWRDPVKAPETPEHWVAAFYLALSDDFLKIFDTTILVKLSETEKTQPWVYQQRLEEHFIGQDDVMPQRLVFFFICTQKPSESITEFETRIRLTAKKTRYAEMTNLRLCKDTVFWPGMKSDIQDLCHSCGRCAQFQKQNSKEPMKSQTIPE